MLRGRFYRCQVSEFEDKAEKLALSPVAKLIEFKFIDKNPALALYPTPQLFVMHPHSPIGIFVNCSS